MNLQQLRYLVATADHRTMTAAAAACHVAQPALTRAVRGLEHELGLTLFARRGRGVELTPDGHRVLVTARMVVDGVASIEELGRRRYAAPTLTVAATPTVQSDLGSGLVERFWARHPDIVVRFVTGEGRAQICAAVAEGRADAGLTDLPAVGPIRAVPFEVREVVVMAPPGSNLPDPVSMAELADVAMILPSPGSVRRSELEAGFAAAGVVPRVAFESDDRATWAAAVLAGVGCCLWYRASAEESARRGARLHTLAPRRFVTMAVVHRLNPSSPVTALLGVVDDAGPVGDAPAGDR